MLLAPLLHFSAGCKAKVLVSRASTKDLSEIPLFIAKHISVQTSPQAGLGSDLLRTYLRFKDTWWWSGGEKKFLRREREKGAPQLKRLQQQQDQVSTILGGKNEFFLHSVCEHDKESANHFVLLDNEGMRSKEEHESSPLVLVLVLSTYPSSLIIQ